LISAVGRQTGKMQAFSLQTKISHRRQHGIHDTAVLFGFKAAG
jgi:hypothetical protein